MIWNDMERYGTVYATVWNGMERYGMIWNDMEWYGMVWNGMEWYRVIRRHLRLLTMSDLVFWLLANWCWRNCVTLWLTSWGMRFWAKKRRRSRNCVASSSLKDLKPAIRLLIVLIRVAEVMRDLNAITQFKTISVSLVGCKGLSPTPNWQKLQSIHIRY